MMKNKAQELFFGLALIGILLTTVVFYFVYLKQPNNIQLLKENKQRNERILFNGSLTLTADKNKKIVSKGEIIQMTLTGNTKSSIIGYDVVVRYDPKKAILFNTKVIDTRYQIVKTETSGEAIITGYLGTKETVPAMRNNKLLLLSFRAVSKGESNIALYIEKTTSRKDSNLINEKGGDVLNYVYTDHIVVGDKQELNVHTPKTIDNVQYMINSQILPKKDCIDCFIKTVLIVEKNNAKRKATIALNTKTGNIHEPITAFDMAFQLKLTPANKTILYFYNNKTL